MKLKINYLLICINFKILSSPIEIFTCKKPFRTLVGAFVISVSYQMMLMYSGFTDYLLDIDEGKRIGFVNSNKEGLFSTIGYVSIYLTGQSICLYLRDELKESAL